MKICKTKLLEISEEAVKGLSVAFQWAALGKSLEIKEICFVYLAVIEAIRQSVQEQIGVEQAEELMKEVQKALEEEEEDEVI